MAAATANGTGKDSNSSNNGWDDNNELQQRQATSNWKNHNNAGSREGVTESALLHSGCEYGNSCCLITWGCSNSSS